MDMLLLVGFLPPIIFNAGYMINRRLFFANMGGIVALAFLGTAFSTLLVGLGLWGLGQAGWTHDISLMETICFGSLISATDPVSTLAVFTELRVDPTLFYLVFGESVMNDAVAITLFRTTGKYVGLEIGAEEGVVAFLDFVISFVGSVIIGYGLGLFSAWMFKKVDMNHHNHILVTIFVGTVYIPFFLAETLQLSGIVTILFTAITAKRYSNRNMDEEAKHQCAFVFEVMAYLSETAVFMYLGLNVFAKVCNNSDVTATNGCYQTILCLVCSIYRYVLISMHVMYICVSSIMAG
jgi:NhaP-type Na+/H+ or K+/H+ antiporter